MKRLIALLVIAPATSAGAFSLEWPVDCTLGDTCYIQNYMDRDTGPNWADFTCGPQSYDGHKGTDIALPSIAAMQSGVSVRAAARGVVKAVRDGMEDISIRAENAPKVSGRECGNGLVIDHGDGWETQYCHMKKGSLRPRKGELVATGESLGLIGLSGQTEFPHLHISLRHNGTEIDPFDPDGAASCGKGPLPGLWNDPVSYTPGGLVGLGLTDHVPEWAQVKDGFSAPPPDKTAPALVVWASYYGNRAGDQLDLAILAPKGNALIEKSVPLERTQARGFRAIGKKGSNWPAGQYQVRAVLLRQGVEIDRKEAAFTLR